VIPVLAGRMGGEQFVSPQRHREHRGSFSFVRSGDGDRIKKLSPSGISVRRRPGAFYLPVSPGK
jgi:hypothetical protein